MRVRNYNVTLPGHIYGLAQNPLYPRAAGDPAQPDHSQWWALGLTLAGLALWEVGKYALSPPDRR